MSSSKHAAAADGFDLFWNPPIDSIDAGDAETTNHEFIRGAIDQDEFDAAMGHSLPEGDE